MNARQMIDLVSRSPFTPLEIHPSDGTAIRVEHPYEIATRPTGSSCIVYEEDRWRFVSYRNITEVITSPINGS